MYGTSSMMGRYKIQILHFIIINVRIRIVTTEIRERSMYGNTTNHKLIIILLFHFDKNYLLSAYYLKLNVIEMLSSNT